MLDPSYNVYMDELQRINLQLMRELAAIGVGFAFPTRTLHLASMSRQAEAEPGAAREDRTRTMASALP